nr:MAG TPA: hypothetical protein [Bacteriophage sp.]
MKSLSLLLWMLRINFSMVFSGMVHQSLAR